MTLIQMEYFICTAREQNFTKAAAKLYITQQSLSASIASLEKELGCKLFIRTVPLELTYAGKEFLKYANQILGEISTLKHHFNDINLDQKGILRIGIASTRARSILPEILESFSMNYPGIQVIIHENTNDELQTNILNREIDLAIANFQTKKKNLILKDFYQEEVVLFASDSLLNHCFGKEKENIIQQFQQGHFQALNHCPFVLGNPKDIAGKIATKLFEQAEISPSILLKADNAELLLALSLKGLGFCFCPILLAKTSLSKKDFDSLYQFHLGKIGKYQIRFAYRKEEHIWNVLNSFMEIAMNSKFI